MPVNRYDVSGMDLRGDGRKAPAGTILKLTDEQAAEYGLTSAKPAAAPSAKPAAKASTRKRPAPKR